MTSKGELIYWEKQQKAFCGVHCINNLIQCPLFEEKNFTDIANKLDTQEKELMGIKAGTKVVSQNSDKVGNFSIQVLWEAIRLTGLQLDNLQSEQCVSARQSPVTQTGYVCNKKNHWFALRRLNERWYNLDSMSKRGPTLITDLYLSSHLKTLSDDGYTVCVVSGKYPLRSQDDGAKVAGRGNNFDESKIVSMAGDAHMVKDAVDTVKAAIVAESAGNIKDAKDKYTAAIELFMKERKNLTDKGFKAALETRIKEYMKRAEDLQNQLSHQT